MLSKGSRYISVWLIIFFVNFLILALIVLGTLIYADTTFSWPEEPVIVLACVSLLVVFLWTLWSWRVLTGSLFNPYVMFLIAAALFNGGRFFLEIFGLNTHGMFTNPIFYVALPPTTLLQTILLVTLGLGGFHTGGLLSVLVMHVRNSSRQGAEERDVIPTEKILRFVGWCLLAISIVPTFLILKDNLAVALTLGYDATFVRIQEQGQGLARSPAILSAFIVPGVLFLLAGSKNFRFNVALSLVIVLAYSSIRFLIGQRAEGAMFLLAYAWVYHRCIRPLPKTLLLAGSCLLLFVLFPLVSAIRLMAAKEVRFSPSALLNTFLSIDNPIVASISELGFSGVTVAYTLELVPGYRGFDMGRSYLFGVSTILPNLFTQEHPPMARYLSFWLVDTLLPARGVTGLWGLGYSFIAEAYINFGWFGAPIALGILGFFMGWLVLWADKSADLAKIAMVGSFTAFVLLYVRGESATYFFRPLVWYALIPFLGVSCLRWLITRRFYGRGSLRRSEGHLTDFYGKEAQTSSPPSAVQPAPHGRHNRVRPQRF